MGTDVLGRVLISDGSVPEGMGLRGGGLPPGSRAGVEPEPGLAPFRLAQGKTDAALSGLRVALAPESQSRLRRSRLLGGMVEAALAAARLEEARSAGQEPRDRR